MAAALWLDLLPARKLVLVALCDRAEGTTGKCWPGREEIAARSSISLKSTTEHLKALEEAGWIRSKRGNSRAGETTLRWVNVQRIISEGQGAQAAHRQGALSRLGEETTPDPAQLALGEVEAPLGEVDGNDQVKVTDVLGEAASLITVSDPSYDPSTNPSAPPAAEMGVDQLSAFEAAVRNSFLRTTADELLRCPPRLVGPNVVMRIEHQQLHRQLSSEVIDGASFRKTLRMCVAAAGLSGYRID